MDIMQSHNIEMEKLQENNFKKKEQGEFSQFEKLVNLLIIILINLLMSSFNKKI